MEANKIDYCSLQNSKLIDGIIKTADVVSETFGPKGHCVAIETGFGIPDITRDGATVAKAINLEDPIENMGAELLKKAAQNTEDQAGDGTSTTSILIRDLVKTAREKITSKVNLNEVKSGMEKACKDIIDTLKSQSDPVNGDFEKIRQVATVSSNNDPEIGNLIVDCMKQVGIEGVITADLSKTLETKIEVISGFKIDRGWSSPNFVNSPKDGKCILENPCIAVLGEKLSNIPQIQPLIQGFAQSAPGRELLVICDDIDDSILTFFLFNNLQGALKCCVVKGVDFGDSRKNIMEDIAVYTGATYITPEYGLEVAKVGPEVLGEAKKVTISKDSCIIYEGQGDPETISNRLEILKDRSQDPDISKYEKDKFDKRVASLSGGVGVIKAGGASEVEQGNRKATIEDAILASKSAIDEGVLPGGGSVFLKISKNHQIPKSVTPDEALGMSIVYDSLKSIITTISENSGVCPDVVIQEILKSKKPGYGYNAKTGKYGNLSEMGVLDSMKVLRVSLENAVSTASMAILTSCTVTKVPETND